MVRARDSPRREELEGRRDAQHKGAWKVRAQGKLELANLRLVVTPSLRRHLKKPAGGLFPDDRLSSEPFLSELRSSPLVIAVGDRVTERLQELGRTPDVQVVDQVERRVKRKAPDVPFLHLFKARNPAGTVTFKAMRAIE